MVLSMVVALVTCPAMLATAEAVRQGQSKDKREEHRARRCNLVATCVKASSRSREIDGRRVVLRNNKVSVLGLHRLQSLSRPTNIGNFTDLGVLSSNIQVYIDTVPDDDQDQNNHDEGYIDGEDQDEDEEPSHSTGRGNSHPFAGYYLPYPDSGYEGLVSTISDNPPMLNWIYVDKKTYEVKYGLRVDAQPNITGPFDCTRQDRRMTLQGWEGFVAVEEQESPGVWALYFDGDDDGLKSKVPRGTRVLEIELWRREKRWKKDPVVRQQEQAQAKTTA
ncbi:hypothetical protein PV08_07121 [Exophiala spinifera]|uniref:Uncharacterized protein n=1 Tax=Exophiala spinifera TaxID=91928 RepID=A0A0D2BSS9_9EURO|nr:uncharacterized protein PV08_07121 [Exophiala spinifera]KIW14339.1 hypothetical protein PV08_07121 [Exophiala spinifera]